MMDEICSTNKNNRVPEFVSASSLIFDTYDDADKVLTQLNKLIRDYGQVTVGDLFDLAGFIGNWTDNESGWTSLSAADIVRVRDGFEICLPVPEELTPVYTESPSETNVDHPNHYQSETGLEAIDAIEAFTFDLTGVEAFDTGNALKYLFRWKKKNGVEDLKKALWYINHLIKHVENLKEENSND